MSDTTYDLFQLGRRHLRKGMAAQATVPLEKATVHKSRRKT